MEIGLLVIKVFVIKKWFLPSQIRHSWNYTDPQEWLAKTTVPKYFIGALAHWQLQYGVTVTV